MSYKRILSVMLALCLATVFFTNLAPRTSEIEPVAMAVSAGNGNGVLARGIDVSHWQGSIDWNKVKAAGISFAIIRAGGKEKDTAFEANYAGAKAAGLDVGCYIYCMSTTTAGAKQDAANMNKWISGKQFEYPVYLDYEDGNQCALSRAQNTEIAMTFLDEMTRQGWYMGIYSYEYFMDTYLDMAVIGAKYDTWVANWLGSPTAKDYSSKHGMWQYSDCGSISGISGDVDLDVAYKHYPSLIEQSGKNGFGDVPPQKGDNTLRLVDASVPTVISPGSYFIVRGTVLSEHNITEAAVTIYNFAGNKVISRSAAPMKPYYNLNELDDYIAFDKLQSGVYVYTITAADESGAKRTLLSAPFNVTTNDALINSGYSQWTVTEAVRLRSGAGLGYSQVELIPSGNTVNVTETAKADGYTWGKCTYNGVSGWFALEFAKMNNSVCGKPVLSVSASNSANSTVFTWNPTSYTDGYSLTIYTAAGDTFRTVDGIEQCETRVSLPAGSYKATLYSQNGYGRRASEEVYFEVAAHVHTEGEWAVVKNAGCVDSGLRQQHCAVCGEVLASETIPPVGHTAGEPQTVKPATCTEDGLLETRCTVCGEVLASETIPPAGHTAGEPQTVKPATCTEDGLLETRCADCGEVLESQKLPASGHDFGEWGVSTPPTYTDDGVLSRHCTVCGAEETEPIEKLSYNLIVTGLAVSPAGDGSADVTVTLYNMGKDAAPAALQGRLIINIGGEEYAVPLNIGEIAPSDAAIQRVKITLPADMPARSVMTVLVSIDDSSAPESDTTDNYMKCIVDAEG